MKDRRVCLKKTHWKYSKFKSTIRMAQTIKISKLDTMRLSEPGSRFKIYTAYIALSTSLHLTKKKRFTGNLPSTDYKIKN